MNLLDPWRLRTFLTAAATLSFRKTAQELALAPSTVTTQIKALEEDLGLRLFDRHAGQVALTEHGRRLVDHARRLLDLEALTRQRMAGRDDAGLELVVRLSESLGLALIPAILPEFRRRFPRIGLTLTTGSRQGLARELRQGNVDLGLVMGQPFVAEGVAMEEIHREPLAVIVSPENPLAGRGRVSPSDLDGCQLLVTPYVWSARTRVEQALGRAGASPAAVTECASLEIVKRCVAAGHGLALAPRLAVRQEERAGTLVVLAWADGPLDAPVTLLRQAGRTLCEPGSVFLELTRAMLRREKEEMEGEGRERKKEEASGGRGGSSPPDPLDGE